MRKQFLFYLLSLTSLFLISCSENKTGAKPVNQRVQAKIVEKGVPVEVQVIHKKIIRQEITLSGVVQPIHKVDIVSETSGKVSRVSKKLGQAVTTKDTLAYIDDEIPVNNFRQAQAQWLSAKNNFKIAQLNLSSDKALFESEDISELAFQNSTLAVKNAEANLLNAKSLLAVAEKGFHDTRIRSPFNGLISRCYIDLGMMVQPGMALYQVVDLSTLKLELGVAQDIIGLLKIGSEAQVELSAVPDRQLKGKVQFISPAADEANGTFTAEIHIPNANGTDFRAGMTARATLFLSDPKALVAVPDEALIRSNGSADIYRLKNGKAVFTRVSLGSKRGAQTVVNEGLAEGDTIVVVGHKQLGNNSKVWIEAVH